MEMNAAFWHGKRVFITGHTGFKGSWLSLWLQQLGAEVTGFAQRAPTNPSLFELARVATAMKSIEGDVRDFPSLCDALIQAQPSIVFHLAAQPLVRRSYAEPVETYATNVMGTVHLLEAVRVCKSVRAVVNVTTDKCYENREWVWPYRESEPMGGLDPYSSSKGCSELVTAAYRASFLGLTHSEGRAVGVATARAGNVIGGGDWAEDRLLPDIIKAFSKGETARIRNPQAIRPWQHVLEPLRGYLLLAQRLWEQGMPYAEGWNFGPDLADDRPVEWVVKAMAERWGADAGWTTDTGNHPHEAQYLRLDVSKAKEYIGWQPILRLEQAIELTINWHTRFNAGEDPRLVTNDQISNYQKTWKQ